LAALSQVFCPGVFVDRGRLIADQYHFEGRRCAIFAAVRIAEGDAENDYAMQQSSQK
jgi:hypothetical protein